MEESQAKGIMRSLSDLDLRYMSVVAAPCRGKFSGLSGTFTYNDLKVKCFASDIFNVSVKQLSNPDSREKQEAVRRLMYVLNNREIGPQLFQHIETSSNEVRKFLGIATLLLNPLCSKLELSRRVYVTAMDTTELHNPPPSISFYKTFTHFQKG